MILVTGGTGLVGSHLLLKLAKSNEKVRALYRTANGIEKTKALFDYIFQKSIRNRAWSAWQWSYLNKSRA